LVAGCLFLPACRAPSNSSSPSIEFSRIPQADQGGRAKNDIIEGRVKGARPGQRIVLYAKSATWWVQPLASRPFTTIQDDAKWINATHLGTEYAALLVDPGYRPPSATNELPARGGAVAAIAIVKGASVAPSKSLWFSGYEWRLRDAPSSRGGRINVYHASNVWTDASGALHLRIAKEAGEWTCAELSLTRSLGYGTYLFTVRDTSHLEPSAVFTVFTWDYSAADQNFREMDIEISRWGDPTSRNAQYVVQPHYVAENLARFEAPSGVLTHSFRWEPGRLAFRTVRGSSGSSSARAVAEHVFTSGVPAPGIESVRMNLYVSGRGTLVPIQRGAEVVVEKFEYLP
jgi:hypothetical protein